MNETLSPDAKAILLLTAPLIAGPAQPTDDLLTPSEYKKLARCLFDRRLRPADLLMAGGEPVEIPTSQDNSFAVDAADIESRITDKTNFF